MMDGHMFLRSVRLKPDAPAAGYPFDMPAIGQMGQLSLDHPVVFFVGDNGAGKSTLLEALVVASGLNAEGGSRNFRYATRESHSCLSEHLTLARGIKRPRDSYFLRAESYYTLSSEIDNLNSDGGLSDAYGARSLHERSHGEGFLALVANRFRGGGLYFMDEPESALSGTGQLAMLREMDRLVRCGSQLIIATHSPFLLAYPGALIYQFSSDGIEKTDYRATDNYLLAKRFLSAPHDMVREVLADKQ